MFFTIYIKIIEYTFTYFSKLQHVLQIWYSKAEKFSEQFEI